jgi:hypothetical protein
MPNIPELELLAYIYSTVTAANIMGIDQATQNPIAIGVYNDVVQDPALPYVRIGYTDTLNIADEPFDYTTQPTAKSMHFMLDVFSDYTPSTLSIGSQLQTLLQHVEITTANFHGSTWLKSCDYFTDNTTNPARVLRRASLRIECRVEPS